MQLGATKQELQGTVIHELKTQTLVEVVEELLRGVKGFGGWVFLLYQNILSNILHSKILNIPYEILKNI